MAMSKTYRVASPNLKDMKNQEVKFYLDFDFACKCLGLKPYMRVCKSWRKIVK